jgi:hypothetical protein
MQVAIRGYATSKEKQILELYSDCGLSIKKIARIFVCSPSSVRGILQKYMALRPPPERTPILTIEEQRINRVLHWIKVEDGCWEWQGYRHPNGYGRVSWLGKVQWAHRVVWQLCFGDIPDDLWVLHHCDNPPCCNPEHLFLGTPKDNTQDSIRKGRWNAKGLRNRPRKKE